MKLSLKPVIYGSVVLLGLAVVETASARHGHHGHRHGRGYWRGYDRGYYIYYGGDYRPRRHYQYRYYRPRYYYPYYAPSYYPYYYRPYYHRHHR